MKSAAVTAVCATTLLATFGFRAQASGISGKVTEVGGAPSLQMPVDVTAFRWNPANSTWEAMDWIYTEPDDTYQFSGLPDGTYRLLFYHWDRQYLPVYYNNASDFDSATDIPVPPDTVVTDINASIARASTLSGVVLGDDGLPLSWEEVSVEAYRWNAAESRWDFYVEGPARPDGSYVLRGIFPGTYRLVFRDWLNERSETYDDSPDLESGKDIVVLPAANVSGITARMGLLGKVSGLVTGLDGVTPSDNVTVVAYRLDESGSSWAWKGQTGTDAKGIFTIHNLPGGTYRVEFQSWLDGQPVSEFYDNAPDLASANDILVVDGDIAAGIDAELETGYSPSAALFVGVRRHIGAGTMEIWYTGAAGARYVLQEPDDMTGMWDDVGTTNTCAVGTNALFRAPTAPVMRWRIRSSE